MGSDLILSFEMRIEEERRKKRNRSLFITVLLTIVICLLLLQVIFGVTIVEGDSMQPTISDGSIVIFERWKQARKEGDVVIVKMDEGQIIKRIDEIEEDQVYLLGDNLEESVDSRTFGSVDQSRVVGKVVCVIHFM